MVMVKTENQTKPKQILFSLTEMQISRFRQEILVRMTA